MQTLPASSLSLEQTHRQLGFQENYSDSFESRLALDPISESERQDLEQIRRDFQVYFYEKATSEGQVKFLALAPLLRLAGFYRSPLKILLEESIGKIEVPDRDIIVTGRIDLLAVNKERLTQEDAFFWILIVEGKNTKFEPALSLPQLLSYAYKGLKTQDSLWGLLTNGGRYQFVYMYVEGASLTYQMFPFLSLLESRDAVQILQVLKAIACL